MKMEKTYNRNIDNDLIQLLGLPEHEKNGVIKNFREENPLMKNSKITADLILLMEKISKNTEGNIRW